jgi:hypothetical protein
VRPVREGEPKPPRVSVEELAFSLPKRAWRTVAWREGTNVKLQSTTIPAGKVERGERKQTASEASKAD